MCYRHQYRCGLSMYSLCPLVNGRNWIGRCRWRFSWLEINIRYLKLKCDQTSDLRPVTSSTKPNPEPNSKDSRSHFWRSVTHSNLTNWALHWAPSVRGVTEDSGNWQRQPFLTVGQDLSKWWECETSSTLSPAALDPLHAGEIEMHPAAGGSMSLSQLPQQPIIQPLGWGVSLYFILHFTLNISLLHTFQVCFPIFLALNSLSSFTHWMVDLFHITSLFGKLRHSCLCEYYCNYFHPETVIKPPDSQTHWFVLSESHLISSCFLRWKLNFALLLSALRRILNKFSTSDI